MKGVAIVGRKGGTGKTSIAHLLALGAAWRDVPAYLVHTDDREPITVIDRPYSYYDGRDPTELERLTEVASQHEGIFVLDGGGNRPDFDAWIAASMDLVLLPVCPDPEDVSLGLEHMATLEERGATNVRFVVNKWPSSQHERAYVRRWLHRLPFEKVVAALPETKAVRILRESDDAPFQTPPARVNNLSRSIYHLIGYNLGELEKGRDTKAVQVA